MGLSRPTAAPDPTFHEVNVSPRTNISFYNKSMPKTHLIFEAAKLQYINIK